MASSVQEKRGTKHRHLCPKESPCFVLLFSFLLWTDLFLELFSNCEKKPANSEEEADSYVFSTWNQKHGNKNTVLPLLGRNDWTTLERIQCDPTKSNCFSSHLLRIVRALLSSLFWIFVRTVRGLDQFENRNFLFWKAPMNKVMSLFSWSLQNTTRLIR